MSHHMNYKKANFYEDEKLFISPDRTLLKFMGFNNIYSLGRVNYTKAHIPLEMHIHKDSMEICYLFRGRQTYYVAENEYNLSGGDVFITFPDELHGSGTSPEDKSILYYLIIDLRSSIHSFIGYQSDEGCELLNGLNSMKKRQFKGEPSLKNVLDTIIETYLSDKPYKKILLRNLITDFLIRIIELEKSETYGISPEIENTTKYVKDNIYEDIDIADLAKRVNFSTSWFKQKFKKEIGIPPAEYIMRQKVDEAIKTLLRSDLNVTDVAHKLNFSSSQYFSSVFKKFTGTSPKSYR